MLVAGTARGSSLVPAPLLRTGHLGHGDDHSGVARYAARGRKDVARNSSTHALGIVNLYIILCGLAYDHLQLQLQYSSVRG